MTFISFDALADQTGVSQSVLIGAASRGVIQKLTQADEQGTAIDEQLIRYLEYLEETYGTVHTVPTLAQPAKKTTTKELEPVAKMSIVEPDTDPDLNSGISSLKDLEQRLEALVTHAMDLYTEVASLNLDELTT